MLTAPILPVWPYSLHNREYLKAFLRCTEITYLVCTVSYDAKFASDISHRAGAHIKVRGELKCDIYLHPRPASIYYLD